MAIVAVIAKVYPESMEVFDEVKNSIQREMKPYRVDEEEVAFGMKALRVTVLVEDSSGGSDVEERMRKIKGVSEVQVEEVTRV
jgi:elongation factor 1-beta